MYASPSKSALESLVEFYNLDYQILVSELKDTLNPGILSSEACQIVLQMMIKNADHVKKFGNSEKANESAKVLKRLFELVTRLNDITGDMNTLKLQNKEFYREMVLAKQELKLANKKLDDIAKSFVEL